ncbi:hypothetical protein I4U23_006610 [Adineta vaga]|nr:hypothetical protein I4U23_006610 [Adineta vaga]
MATLFPPGYGNFPSYQFSAPNQVHNRYYTDGYRRREASFAPQFPTQPFYQPPFNPNVTYSSSQRDTKAGRPSFGAQLINAFNEWDYKYRQDQYLRRLEKLQRQYWNLENSAGPSAPYAIPPPPPPPSMNYGGGTLFEYEKETEFLPYPVYMNQGARQYGGLPSLGYGGATTLPPKIRVIFVPMGQSFSQQPQTGPLAMPPFLYNRMAQPLCSYPPPPPLPQLGSLSLTPAVQQMVLQRYSNPVAVLPYSSNWQSPQFMMPGYSQGFQQQQQPVISAYQPALPAPQPNISHYMPSYSSSSSAPQSYMSPPAPAPAQFYASLPPPPQSYIPPPSAPAPQTYIPQYSAYSALPPAPQAYIPPPASVPAPVPQPYMSSPNYMQGYSSVPSAPQSYTSPPAASYSAASVNQYMQQHQQQQQPSSSSSSSLQLSSPYYSSTLSPSSSSGPNPSGSYPSVCRACPPAPPPLSVLVTGHCWVQHCSACHHVPISDSNPNVRPCGGRSTPLLRYPTVPQYIPDQTQQLQAQQYAQTHAPIMMRPWLRKSPPLPPGAFVVSDRYYYGDGSRYHHSHRPHRRTKRSSHSKHRSTTVASRSVPSTSPNIQKTSKSISPRRASKTNKDSNPDKASNKSKSTESQTSPSNSSSGLSTEYHKTIIYPSHAQKDGIPQQLTGEARQVNLQYSYQPQELPTVYHKNRYLKSGSESSGLSSGGRTSSDYSYTFSKENKQARSTSSDFNSIPEEQTYRKKPPHSSHSSRKVKDRVIIVREFVPDSPSSMSTVSSNATFNIIGKDIDSISTTSTLEEDKLSGDDDLRL